MGETNDRPRLLITRPEDGARRFAKDAVEAGFAPLIDPMLRIVPRPKPEAAAWAGVAALLLTSPAAAPLAAASAPHDLNVLTVGDATAVAARDAGFQRVQSAAGDAEALAALAVKSLQPGNGRIVHAAGSKRAGDLAGQLSAVGFETATLVLYDQKPAEGLSAATKAAIEAGHIAYASFFSPQTGRTFARLALESGVAENLSRIQAFAISEAVSAAISDLGWQSVTTAEKPTSRALLAKLVAAASGANNGAYRAHER